MNINKNTINGTLQKGECMTLNANVLSPMFQNLFAEHTLHLPTPSMK